MITIGLNNRRRIRMRAPVAYYVDVNGSDANDGLTPETAIKTISRVNSLNLSGTTRTVLFKRGQTWEGTITVPSSGNITNPIMYGAYGIGEKPKIIGSELITGWTLHSGNIWKATFNTAINQLFVNNNRMQVARWPESGLANVDVANSTSSLTCNALNAAWNLTGVKCIIHSSSYGLETKTVTGNVGKTITLDTVPFGDVSLNEKFILVGKLEFLTKAGQWFYDTATNTVYLWKPDGSQPTNTEVRGSTRDYGFSATSKNFWQITNIEFAQQKTFSINLSGCQNYNINNTTTTDPDAKGINDLSCASGVYYKNTVTGANHTGITSELSDNMRFEANIVTRIALFENLGLTGIGAWYGGSGVATHGDNNQIIYNRVDETGYNGISYHGLTTCNWNYVTNWCRSKNDGAAIYTSAPVTDPDYAYGSEQNKGSVVRYNTCEYGWGVNTGTGAYAEGIYLDESSGGVIVEYNTVSYCSGRGIFNHKGNSHNERFNTVFMCGNGIYISRVGNDINMTDNIVYAGLDQEVVHLNALTGTPVVNNNKYINHYLATPFQKDWGTRYNLADWRTTTGQDADSTLDSTALTVGHSEKLLINPTATVKRYYMNNASQVINDVTKTEISAGYVDVPAWGSIIVTGLNVDCILDYADSVAPVITAFILPETANSLVVDITTLSASDATDYFISENNTTPLLTTAGWTSTPPTTYTFTSTGVKTLYVWVRDAAGNISIAVSDTVTVSVPFPIPTENILGLWNMNETSGSTVADVKGINNGTATGTTIVNGKFGNARQFNGTSDKVSMARPTLFNVGMTNNFSISMWGKIITSGTYRCFIEIGVDNNNYTSLFTDGQSRVNAMMRCTGTLYQKRVSSGIVTTGTWHHFVVTWNATTKELKLYVNGIAYTTDYADYLPREGAVMTVGAAGSNRYLNGEIDQIIIGNTVFTQTQITDLYNSGNGRDYN